MSGELVVWLDLYHHGKDNTRRLLIAELEKLEATIDTVSVVKPVGGLSRCLGNGLFGWFRITTGRTTLSNCSSPS